MTTQELAKQALDCFVRKEREDETQFTCLKDEHPEWVQNMVHEAHGAKLPDDYCYSWIEAALQNIVDNGMDEDSIFERIDNEVDCYTSGLTEWLNSRNDRVFYLTEALEEVGMTDGFQALSMAQFKEISEVFGSVLQFLNGKAEE